MDPCRPRFSNGLHHSDGAVNRWWRPEVLGSTVSPGAGGGKKKKRGKGEEILKGAKAAHWTMVVALLHSRSRDHCFYPAAGFYGSHLHFYSPCSVNASRTNSLGDLLRASILTTSDRPISAVSTSFAYAHDDPFARPSSAYLGPPSLLGHGSSPHLNTPRPFSAHSPFTLSGPAASSTPTELAQPSTVTYHGVCLTVWSHADAERSNAIRRTLEAGRSRKESAQSLVASRLKSLRADANGINVDSLNNGDPTIQARRTAKQSARGPWADAETDNETENDGAMSESDFDVASTVGHGPGESTLFLPGDTVFWLPYALTLVSRHPIYDLMRDYLTLSWARFSKDVQSHTLQISKILAHPAPRAGELIRLDASPKADGSANDTASLEVIARFPGGLDFGRGLVDINFTMWPLFKCLNIDNILTICEIALSPTGRVLFFSRHPAMLGIAVSTIKYLVELRGWNGIALPAVHSRDAKIYIDDPGPWIMGAATEMRYAIRPAPEVCVCDLDINYLSCPRLLPVLSLSSNSGRSTVEPYSARLRLIIILIIAYRANSKRPSLLVGSDPCVKYRQSEVRVRARSLSKSSRQSGGIRRELYKHLTSSYRIR
ncbi:AEX-3 domain-containing protein [Salix suchowensis]|nr:AEX-3 domain-containing protein [Salix suchowensis]